MRPRSRLVSFLVNTLMFGSVVFAVLIGGWIALMATAPSTSATVTVVQLPSEKPPHKRFYQVHYATDRGEACDGTIIGSVTGIRVGDTVPIRYLRVSPCDNPSTPYGGLWWLPLIFPMVGVLVLGTFVFTAWHRPDLLGRLVLRKGRP